MREAMDQVSFEYVIGAFFCDDLLHGLSFVFHQVSFVYMVLLSAS